MRVISVHQPWAQLIADRRRHIIIKCWKAEPGEKFVLHAAHVRNDAKCLEFGYSLSDVPTNAFLGLLEVKKCIDRGLVRPSKFDVSSKKAEGKRLYAIAVRTIEKYRKSIPMRQPRPLSETWECDWQAIGKASARLAQKQATQEN